MKLPFQPPMDYSEEELEKGRRFIARVEQSRNLRWTQKRKLEFEGWKRKITVEAEMAATKRNQE